MMTVLQAIDHIGCVPRLSTQTLKVYKAIRALFPKFVGDQPKYKDLNRIKSYFEESALLIAFKNGGSTK